jgi:hypothetical protein
VVRPGHGIELLATKRSIDSDIHRRGVTPALKELNLVEGGELALLQSHHMLASITIQETGMQISAESAQGQAA